MFFRWNASNLRFGENAGHYLPACLMPLFLALVVAPATWYWYIPRQALSPWSTHTHHPQHIQPHDHPHLQKSWKIDNTTLWRVWCKDSKHFFLKCVWLTLMRKREEKISRQVGSSNGAEVNIYTEKVGVCVCHLFKTRLSRWVVEQKWGVKRSGRWKANANEA